jgi:hypothetical protein
MSGRRGYWNTASQVVHGDGAWVLDGSCISCEHFAMIKKRICISQVNLYLSFTLLELFCCYASFSFQHATNHAFSPPSPT